MEFPEVVNHCCLPVAAVSLRHAIPSLRLAAMSNLVEQIQAANLHQIRLPIANAGDELRHFAQTFNRMLNRLEVSMEQQRRFMADASHERRTSVAIVRCKFVIENIDEWLFRDK